MSKSSLLRLFSAALGGAVVAGALLGVLTFINADGGFARCTATTGLGWTLPLLAGLTTAGLAWALASGPAPTPEEPGVLGCRCESCGGPVFGDKRLCPHCGERLDPQRTVC